MKEAGGDSGFLPRPGNCYFCGVSPVLAYWRENQLCQECARKVKALDAQTLLLPIKSQTWWQAKARERFVRVMRKRRSEETFPRKSS